MRPSQARYEGMENRVSTFLRWRALRVTVSEQRMLASLLMGRQEPDGGRVAAAVNNNNEETLREHGNAFPL